jgi:hypothetical protein
LRRGQFLLGFGREGCKSPGVPEKEGALTCKGDAAAGAIEEANAQIIFQCIDLKGDSRLREKKLLRRFVKTELFRNHAEYFQPEVFQPRHVTIIGANWRTATVPRRTLRVSLCRFGAGTKGSSASPTE